MPRNKLARFKFRRQLHRGDTTEGSIFYREVELRNLQGHRPLCGCNLTVVPSYINQRSLLIGFTWIVGACGVESDRIVWIHVFLHWHASARTIHDYNGRVRCVGSRSICAPLPLDSSGHLKLICSPSAPNGSVITHNFSPVQAGYSITGIRVILWTAV